MKFQLLNFLIISSSLLMTRADIFAIDESSFFFQYYFNLNNLLFIFKRKLAKSEPKRSQ
jgi:hypothetical protein